MAQVIGRRGGGGPFRSTLPSPHITPTSLYTPPSSPPTTSPHDTFENALNTFLQHETKENFSCLLSEVFSHGYAIDFEMKGGQTLLHHAVSLNLERETALVLNCGARLLQNHQKKTPIDCALERGNQILLQLLRRSSDYFNYLRSKNNAEVKMARVVSSFQDSTEQVISGVCRYAWSPTQGRLAQEGATMWAPSFRFTDIYDDYLDWNDRKSAEMLQVLSSPSSLLPFLSPFPWPETGR
jgi:hypothetical protein